MAHQHEAAPAAASDDTIHDLPAWRAKAVGKAASFILRHGAPKMGVPMRDDGYVRVEDLLAADPMRKHKTTLQDLKWVVENNDKKRYQLMQEGGTLFIRATQGHSIDVSRRKRPLH